jgi:hypothetical protein
MTMNKRPTWKEIIQSSYAKHGTRNQFFIHIVKPTGYPYFEWNDRIYRVIGWDDYEDTGLTVEDIERVWV